MFKKPDQNLQGADAKSDTYEMGTDAFKYRKCRI